MASIEEDLLRDLYQIFRRLTARLLRNRTGRPSSRDRELRVLIEEFRNLLQEHEEANRIYQAMSPDERQQVRERMARQMQEDLDNNRTDDLDPDVRREVDELNADRDDERGDDPNRRDAEAEAEQNRTDLNRDGVDDTENRRDETQDERTDRDDQATDEREEQDREEGGDRDEPAEDREGENERDAEERGESDPERDAADRDGPGVVPAAAAGAAAGVAADELIDEVREAEENDLDAPEPGDLPEIPMGMDGQDLGPEITRPENEAEQQAQAEQPENEAEQQARAEQPENEAEQQAQSEVEQEPIVAEDAERGQGQDAQEHEGPGQELAGQEQPEAEREQPGAEEERGDAGPQPGFPTAGDQRAAAEAEKQDGQDPREQEDGQGEPVQQGGQERQGGQVQEGGQENAGQRPPDPVETRLAADRQAHQNGQGQSTQGQNGQRAQMSPQEQANADRLYRGGQVSPTEATRQQGEPATAGRGGQTAGQQHQRSMDRSGGRGNDTGGRTPGGD